MVLTLRTTESGRDGYANKTLFISTAPLHLCCLSPSSLIFGSRWMYSITFLDDPIVSAMTDKQKLKIYK